jgi:hypothetical protein
MQLGLSSYTYTWAVGVPGYLPSKPFKARVTILSGFPVSDNPPFLSELDHFILSDMGSHILDIVRYLFGECKKPD